MKYIAKNVNYYTARGLEQYYMIQYHTLDYLNRINGISPRNGSYPIYMQAAYKYIYNQLTNELYIKQGK